MFRDPATDPGHDPPEVELKAGAEQALLGNRHLQDHEPGSWLEYPSGLCQAGVEIHQVPNSPADHRTIEGLVRERQLQRVGCHWVEESRLVTALLQHRPHKIGSDDSPPKPTPAGERGAEIQGSSAEVEVDSFRLPFPPQPRDSGPPPALVESKADDAVEPVVRGSYGSEDGADIGPLFRTA